MVMKGYSCSRGRTFESRHPETRLIFYTFICCKIVVWKDTKINKKRVREWPIKTFWFWKQLLLTLIQKSFIWGFWGWFFITLAFAQSDNYLILVKWGEINRVTFLSGQNITNSLITVSRKIHNLATFGQCFSSSYLQFSTWSMA